MIESISERKTDIETRHSYGNAIQTKMYNGKVFIKKLDENQKIKFLKCTESSDYANFKELLNGNWQDVKNIWEDESLRDMLSESHSSLVILNHFYEKYIYFYDQSELTAFYNSSEESKKQWDKISMFRPLQEEKVITRLFGVRRIINRLNGIEYDDKNPVDTLSYYLTRKACGDSHVE